MTPVTGPGIHAKQTASSSIAGVQARHRAEDYHAELVKMATPQQAKQADAVRRRGGSGSGFGGKGARHDVEHKAQCQCAGTSLDPLQIVNQYTY